MSRLNKHVIFCDGCIRLYQSSPPKPWDIIMKLRLMKHLFAALAFEILNIINIINSCCKR